VKSFKMLRLAAAFFSTTTSVSIYSSEILQMSWIWKEHLFSLEV
jgi:hypothetical protein